MVRLARLRSSNKARAAYLRRRSTYAPMHDRRGVGRGERGWFFQSKVFKGGKFTRSGNWSVIVLLLDPISDSLTIGRGAMGQAYKPAYQRDFQNTPATTNQNSCFWALSHLIGALGTHFPDDLHRRAGGAWHDAPSAGACWCGMAQCTSRTQGVPIYNK